MKVSKNRKLALDALDLEKVYEPIDAIKVLKEKTFVKFDETLDISINLNIDASKTEQNIKGVTNLPNGTGKKVRVAVITSDDNITEAKDSGADLYGGQEFIDNISSNKIDFDILIATPDIMPKLGKVAKTLGPKGLMPNPKSGTVTTDIAGSVKDLKSGKIELRVEKNGIVHAQCGKSSFDQSALEENVKTVYETIMKAKPASVKGTYFKKMTISTTMGPGIKIDHGNI